MSVYISLRLFRNYSFFPRCRLEGSKTNIPTCFNSYFKIHLLRFLQYSLQSCDLGILPFLIRFNVKLYIYTLSLNLPLDVHDSMRNSVNSLLGQISGSTTDSWKKHKKYVCPLTHGGYFSRAHVES
jgi:hypothetical protein